MEEKREACANKKDINVGNDVIYEKLQLFHFKILANRLLLLVVNKHEYSIACIQSLLVLFWRRSQVVVVFELAELAKPGYHSLLEIYYRDAFASYSFFREAVLVLNVVPLLILLVQGLRLGVHDVVHPRNEVFIGILLNFVVDPAVMRLIVRVHCYAPISVLLF